MKQNPKLPEPHVDLVPEEVVAMRMGRSLSYVQKTRSQWIRKGVCIVDMPATNGGGKRCGYLWSWSSVEKLARGVAS